MKLTWNDFLELAAVITNLRNSIYNFDDEELEIKEKNRRVEGPDEMKRPMKQKKKNTKRRERGTSRSRGRAHKEEGGVGPGPAIWPLASRVRPAAARAHSRR